MQDIRSEIIEAYRARYPYISIITHEEGRAKNLITSAVIEINALRRDTGLPEVTIKHWAQTRGIYTDPDEWNGIQNDSPADAIDAIADERSPVVCMMYDAAQFFSSTSSGVEERLFVRALKDRFTDLQRSECTVIFIDPVLQLPEQVRSIIRQIDLDLPNSDQIAECWERKIRLIGMRDDERAQQLYPVLRKQYEEREDALIAACKGLTMTEVDLVISRAIIRRDLDPGLIVAEKARIIKESGLLEYLHDIPDMSGLGGLENLKKAIMRNARRFTAEAERFGLEQQWKVLLTGPPGTGKSLSAKVIASYTSLPLMRLDISSIATRWYGETTARLASALKVAAAASPAVLWIDEIEKLFSGEHEESQRALGVILTFLEESRAPIVWVATSNRPMKLKGELLQRFSKIYHVDLPSFSDCKQIAEIHIRSYNRDPSQYDIDQIAAIASKGYSGREILAAIREGMARAFYAGHDLSTQDIITELKAITPTSESMESDIKNIRDWSNRYAEPAGERSVHSDRAQQAMEMI